MIADGKAVARVLEQKLTKKLVHTSRKKVCFILFGTNLGSRQFVAMKSKVAERLGIVADLLEYPENISNEDALKAVHTASLNDYAGIVIQLPLPIQLNRNQILNSVPADIDIDMLSEESKKNYLAQQTKNIPPVARAVYEILRFYNISLDQKKIVIIGNGKLVGEPVAMLFSVMNIPYTILDIQTNEKEKSECIRAADIIISGVGSPNFIVPSIIKDGVVLIDAGTSEQQGKLVGDVDPLCAEKAALVTPVPGGVGPVTVVSLFLNLLSE